MAPDVRVPRSCACCEARDWQPRWSGFVVCRACGLMTVEAGLSADDAARLYGEDYFHGLEYIDYLADKAALTRTLAQHLRVVQRHVRPGGRLLEVGCAYGFFLELAAPIYPRPVGVDISLAPVAHAQARGWDARVGDLQGLRFDAPFDAVCLWDTIEHLAEPDAVLRRSAELLVPGGHLFLSTGDFGSLLARAQGRRWRQIHPPTHLFYFSRPALRALCRRVGLEVVEFGTARVYRRVGSALQALEEFHAASMSGKAARGLRRVLPRSALECVVGLNLGDTVRLVARKPGPA